VVAQRPPPSEVGVLLGDEPQAIKSVVPTRHLDDGVADVRQPNVDGKVEVRPALLVEIVERRNVSGKVRSQHLGDRTVPALGGAMHAVMVEDDSSVCGQPGVSLQPSRTLLQCERERRQSVVRSVRATTTVRERKARTSNVGGGHAGSR